MMIAKLFAASLAVLAAVGVAQPAAAGFVEQHAEHAYADSYGNLVIHSPAGYKRIVVGQGHLAGQQAAEGEPRVVYLDDEMYRVRNVYRCVRQPAVVHGRSYMYGLPDGALPVIAGPCGHRQWPSFGHTR